MRGCRIAFIKFPELYISKDLDDLICERFGLDLPEADLSDWDMVVDRLLNAEGEVTIGLVGKYVELPDAYKSINEALLHAGITHKTKVNIEYVDAEKLETDNNLLANLKSLDGILVPGGFGERGTLGKMQAITYARENDVPYLGICLGMQLSVIEYAMNVLKIDANSTEFDRKTAEPIIGLITEWTDERGELQIRSDDSDMGGTMRLGAQKAELVEGTKLKEIYGSSVITERHRHRDEMNNRYIEPLQSAGMQVSGYSAKQHLVESVEIAEHPWFIAVQFHPEFTSSPRDGHPLFASFVGAAIDHKARS